MEFTKRETYVADKKDSVYRFWKACADTQSQIWKVFRTGNLRGYRVIVFVPDHMTAAYENKISPPVRKTIERKKTTRKVVCPYVESEAKTRCAEAGQGDGTGFDISGARNRK